MKKITIIIGVLLTISSYGQTDSTLITSEALQAKEIHNNKYTLNMFFGCFDKN